MPSSPPFVHETAIVDQGATLGAGTKIWHFSHVMAGAQIGEDCSLGQGCFVASTVCIGNGVRVQNHVSLYDGVELEDDVFCGPHAVFTNVRYPRAHISRKHQFEQTLVKRGATIGANSTIRCGLTIGEYCLVAAGAVVTRDTEPYSLMVGNPAKRVGSVSRCGEPLEFDDRGRAHCPASQDEFCRDAQGRVQLVNA